MTTNSSRWWFLRVVRLLAERILLFLFGCFFTLLLSEGLLSLAAFVVQWDNKSRNTLDLEATDDEIRVLCIGESTTHGYDGPFHKAQPWPSQLEDLLNSAKGPKTFSVINRGISGTDSSHIMGMLPEWLEYYQPKIVISMLGINDLEHRLLTIPQSEREGFRWHSFRTFRLLTNLLRSSTRRKSQEVSKESERRNLLAAAKKDYPFLDYFIDYSLLQEQNIPLAEQIRLIKLILNRVFDEKLISRLVEIYQKQGKEETALKVLNNFLEENPDNAFIKSMSASLRNPEAAISLLQKAIDLSPRETSFYLDLAGVLRATNKLSEAEAVLMRAFRFGVERRDEIPLELAKIYAKKNILTGKASDLLQMSDFGLSREWLIGEIAVLLKENEGSKAALRFILKYKNEIQSGDTLRIFARLLMEDKQYKRAFDAYQASVIADRYYERCSIEGLMEATISSLEYEYSTEEIKEILLTLSIGRSSSFDDLEAGLLADDEKNECLKKLLNKLPQLSLSKRAAHLNLSSWYLERTDYPSAISELEQAVQIAASDVIVRDLALLFIEYANAGGTIAKLQYSKAKAYLSSYSTDNPMLGLSVLASYDRELIQSNPEKAVRELRVLSLSYPNNPKILEKLSALLIRLLKYEEAEEVLIKAIRKYPYNSTFIDLLLHQYATQERFEEIRKFIQGHLLDFSDADTLQVFNDVYLRIGDYPAVGVILEKAIEKEPFNVNWYLNYGSALFAAKKYEQAINMYAKAAIIDPTLLDQYFSLKSGFRSAVLSLMVFNKGKDQITEFFEQIGITAADQNIYTLKNYTEIGQQIKKFGAFHIVMQYPTLDINPLKKMLGEEHDIIYVENKTNFEKALASHSYEEVYTDYFADTWGHLTPYGNSLIAKNLAKVIKEEILKE